MLHRIVLTPFFLHRQNENLDISILVYQNLGKKSLQRIAVELHELVEHL
jgi:hypothetical protein